MSPLEDLETIDTELILADLEIIIKRKERIGKQLRNGDKATQFEFDLLEKIENHLNETKPIRDLSFEPNENEILKQIQLVTANHFSLLIYMRMKAKILIIQHRGLMLLNLIFLLLKYLPKLRENWLI